MNITVDKIPSLTTAKRYCSYNPKLLPDKKLMRLYAKLVALTNAISQNKLPASYYYRIADPNVTGIAPKDMWLQYNSQCALNECREELERRGLMDKFTVFVLI